MRVVIFFEGRDVWKMSLVENIKLLCDKKPLSQLEKELGFGNGSISKWDFNAPAITKVMKVAKYFGVSIDFLVAEKETIQNNSSIHISNQN
jgi:transcriptional regulator with XRE-family HTH domain